MRKIKVFLGQPYMADLFEYEETGHQKSESESHEHGNAVLLVTNVVLDWDSLEPTYGDGERYLYEFGRLLSFLGFNVSIVQPANINKIEVKDYYGHKIILFPHQRCEAGFFTGFNEKVYELAKYYGKVVYFLPEVAAPLVAENSVVISHGIWFDHANYPEAGFRTAKWFDLLKCALTQPDHLVSCDTNTINFIRCLWPKKSDSLHYIPNFYDPALFFPNKQKRNGKRLTILFPRRAQVSRESKIFASIVEQIPYEVDILWVGEGDGSGNADIEAVCKRDRRCTFIEASFQDIPEYYRKADIVVIPTVASEGASLSCIEALASGCSVVATNVGGLSDIIIDGFNGLMVGTNADEIALGINKLIVDGSLRNQLEDNAVATAKAFVLSRWQDKWLMFLFSIGWISKRQHDYWRRLHSTYISGKKKEWVIVSRNAVHGGVESLICEESRSLPADVVICSGLDNKETVPFLYRRADSAEALAMLIKPYQYILYHWLPDWAIDEIRKSQKPSIEFVHRVDTMDGDKHVPAALVTHSNFLAEHVHEKTGRACEVVPHAIPADFVPATSLGNAIGAIGGYHATKGIDIVICAWAHIYQQFPQYNLAFYGEGEELDALKELAVSKNIQAKFNPPTTKSYKTLQEYRLIVMPSRIEGMPLSILEALAMDIPVISSDFPGAIEFNALAQKRGVNPPITVVLGGDIEGFAKAMREALLNGERPHTSAYIKQFYNAKTHAETIINVMNNTLQHSL